MENEVKRKRCKTACHYCKISHMTCDDGRPCQRCIKRKIGHLCHDNHPDTASTSSHHFEGADSREYLNRATDFDIAAEVRGLSTGLNNVDVPPNLRPQTNRNNLGPSPVEAYDILSDYLRFKQFIERR